MRILIMGAGKMGSFFIDLLSFDHEVAVYEKDAKRLRFTYNCYRFTKMEEIEMFRPELVINAVTVKYTLPAFEEVLPHLSHDCIISDIASVKTGLQEFYEKTADYKNAFFYQKENSRLDDSIRNEHVRMRTADMSLRYQQDSTLLAKNILIEQQKVEMLKLHEGRFFWIGICVLVLVIACFIYLYEKKRRALLLAQSQRTISSLRLENIRNRMSPHFIFNVLNQEMGSREG